MPFLSREIIRKGTGTVTIFAFDKGEGLSEHTAPFDAMVQVIDGKAEITISGNKNILEKGDMIIMPANNPPPRAQCSGKVQNGSNHDPFLIQLRNG